MRNWKNKTIELLAPAGTYEIFKKLLTSGADAFYVGGKQLNMRMHRKDYNLTNEELRQATTLAHQHNKKLYVTLNNMLTDTETDDAKAFLTFLDKIGVDAIIVQDFAIVRLIKELGLSLPIHSSVMMNVHNMPMINCLKAEGVERVVVSREIPLETIHSFSLQTDMEFEYFAHGDMCIAHGSQCLYGGILFGKSSNRGLCMKPCRWCYKVEHNGQNTPMQYPLAVKDMCMYLHIPELIYSNVTSFKIEGRMRSSEYLLQLINQYSTAIDHFLEDPTGYDRTDGFDFIKDNKTRHLSTAFAFGNLGKKNINIDATGETKIFSRATEERELKEADIQKAINALGCSASKTPNLTVKVNNLSSAKAALDAGADEVYLSGEVWNPDKPFTKQEIKTLTSSTNKNIHLAVPRMMNELQLIAYDDLISNYKDLGLSGVLQSNLGSLYTLAKYPIKHIGDYCLNTYNQTAFRFYKEQGLSKITVSIESGQSVLRSLIHNDQLPIEIIVQGAPAVMYLEHNLYNTFNKNDEVIATYNNKEILHLIDEKGFSHPVYVDQYERNHVIMNKDLCLLPILPSLCTNQTKSIRIEGQHYNETALKQVVTIYRNVLDTIQTSTIGERMLLAKQLTKITNRNQTLGALCYE